jgi:hypothetical protein
MSNDNYENPTHKTFPIVFNGQLVGKAESFGEGHIELTIMNRQLIDRIDSDSFRELTIGYSEVMEAPRFNVGDRLRSKRSGRIWNVVEPSEDDKARHQALALGQIPVCSDKWHDQTAYVWSNPNNYEKVDS